MTPLDCAAKPAFSVVLDEAEAEVREAQESAEVLLRHDLSLAGLVGVSGHVIEWWVIEVLDEAI